MTGQPITAAARSIAHIQPAHWQAADHGLVAKILSEFTHEGLFEPAALGSDAYALTSTQTQHRWPCVRSSFH